jgi:hypothetical protein
LFTAPVIFLRFAVSGLFGIVVMRAGGAIDRHPDLLLLPAFTVHPAIAQPKTSWDMTRAYTEAVRKKENTWTGGVASLLALAEVRAHLDFGRAEAIGPLAVVPFVADADDPEGAVAACGMPSRRGAAWRFPTSAPTSSRQGGYGLGECGNVTRYRECWCS